MNKIIISCLFLVLVYLFPGMQTVVIFGGFQIESIEIGIINLILLIPAYVLFLALWEVQIIPRNLLRGFLVIHGLVMIGMGIQSFGGELHSGILGQTVIPSVAIFTPLCLFLPHWKSYRRKGAEQDTGGNAI